MKSLYQYINEKYLYEGDEDKEEDKNKEDEKTTERGEIKFTIWKAPDKKVTWLKNGENFQKIEYVYED